MADNQQGPGKRQINRNLVAAAGAVPGVLAARAGGASMLGAIGGAGLQAVLGPVAALAGLMAGLLRTTISLVRATQLYERGIQRAASIERVESAFTTLYRSAARAKTEVKSLLDFANRTPFRYDSILEAGRTLLVLTRGAFSGAAALKKVGDVSAATNTEIGETSFWLGKLFNYLQSGRSVGNLLFRLQDMGIISGELANKLETLETQGASFSQKWGAVEQEIARANGAMEEENRSLDGLQARLERTSQLMAEAFGQPFLEQEKNSTYSTIKLYEQFLPLLRQVGNETAAITGVWRGWTAELRGGIAEQLGVGKAAKSMYEALSAIGGGVLLASLARVGMVLGRFGGRTFGRGGVVSQVRATNRAASQGTLSGGGQAQFQAGRSDLSQASGDFSQALSQAAALAFVDAAGSIARGSGRAVRGYAQSVRGRAADLAARGAAAPTSLMGRAANIANLGTGAAAGVVVLTDAFRKLGSVAMTVLRFIGRGFLALGWVGTAIVAVGALAISFWRANRASEEARKANQALGRSIADTSAAMKEQIRNVRTLTDYYAAQAQAVENLSKAQAALANFTPGDAPRAQARERRKMLEQAVGTARDELAQVQRRGRGALLRKPEEETERARNRRDVDDTEFDIKLQQADEGERARLLAERAAQLRRDAAEGSKLREAERVDPSAQRERELQAERQILDNEKEQADAFRQKFNDSPAVVREEIRGDLAARTGTPQQQAEIQSLVEQLAARGVEAPKGQLVFGKIGELQQQQRQSRSLDEVDKLAEAVRLLERLGEVRGAIQSKPSDAEVETEIQSRIQRGTDIQDELKANTEALAENNRSSKDPLRKDNQQIEDLQGRLADSTNPAEQAVLRARIQALIEQTNRAQLNKESAPELDIAARRAEAESKQNRFQADLSANDLETERKILALRGEGLAYEMQAHELRLAGLRAAAARTEQEFGKDDQRSIAARNSVTQEERRGEELQRQQARAADEIVTNRAINQAVLRGDRKGAQALRDQAEIKGRARNYVETFGAKPGDAMAQAGRDYFLEQAAAARDQAPRITADSMQAIGGGGRASANDPLKQVMERNARWSEMIATNTQELLQVMRGQTPSPMEKAGYN